MSRGTPFIGLINIEGCSGFASVRMNAEIHHPFSLGLDSTPASARPVEPAKISRRPLVCGSDLVFAVVVVIWDMILSVGGGGAGELCL